MTLQRIEDALERLEAAAQRPAPGLAQLQASNARLREAIAAAIAQIDGLMARQAAEPKR